MCVCNTIFLRPQNKCIFRQKMQIIYLSRLGKILKGIFKSKGKLYQRQVYEYK